MANGAAGLAPRWCFGVRWREYAATLPESSHVLVQGTLPSREYEEDGVKRQKSALILIGTLTSLLTTYSSFHSTVIDLCDG